MHEIVRDSLTAALRRAVELTKEAVVRSVSDFSSWRSTGSSSWEGATIQRPRLEYLFFDPIIEEIAAKFAEAFAIHYPKYCGQVGFPGVRMALTPIFIVSALVRELWERSWPATPAEPQVTQIVDEFADYLRKPKVTFVYYALINTLVLPDTLDSLDLPKSVRILRLDDDEVAMLSGVWGQEPREMFQPYRYAFVGELELEKKFGPSSKGEEPPLASLHRKIERTLLGMRCLELEASTPLGSTSRRSLLFRSNLVGPATKTKARCKPIDWN